MESKPLFNHPVLHFLSRTNPIVAIVLYILTAFSILIYGAFRLSYDWSTVILIFLSGLLVFTLIEYMMHRFMYHSGDDYLNEKTWQYKIHGVHHTFPRNEAGIAMPIPLAYLLGSVFFGIFYLIMGETSWVFFPGFFLGYALYLMVHYLIHTRRPPNNVFHYLWIHHHLHHHKLDNKAFGVSSPLWDVVFGTMPPKKYRSRRT